MKNDDDVVQLCISTYRCTYVHKYSMGHIYGNLPVEGTPTACTFTEQSLTRLVYQSSFLLQASVVHKIQDDGVLRGGGLGSIDETSMVSMGVWSSELTGVDCVCSVQGIHSLFTPSLQTVKTFPYIKKYFMCVCVCVCVCEKACVKVHICISFLPTHHRETLFEVRLIPTFHISHILVCQSQGRTPVHS